MPGSYSAVTTTCETVFRTCEKQYLDQTASILLLNSTNSSDALCQLAVQTLLCLSVATCPPSPSPISSVGLFRINVQDAQNKYCGYVETPTTPPPFLPAVPILSSCVPPGLVPANTTTQPANLAQPNIQSSAATDASCLRVSSKPLLHCSAFGYSHLRAFAASSIQTCLLPGSWYLFKHQLLTVEVSAVADMEIEVPYTRIHKVLLVCGLCVYSSNKDVYVMCYVLQVRVVCVSLWMCGVWVCSECVRYVKVVCVWLVCA